MSKIKITYLDEIPRIAQKSIGKYHAALLEFIESGKPAAHIAATDYADTKRYAEGFHRAILKYKLPVCIIKLGTDIYLQKKEGTK